MSGPSTSRSFGSAPAYRPGLESKSQRGVYNSPVGPPPFGGTQPPNGGRNRYPYPGGGYSRAVYAVPGWLGSGFYGYGYGYPDDAAYAGDQQSAEAAPQDAGNQEMPPDSGYPSQYPPQQGYAPRPDYQPQAPAQADVHDQPAVTLLFKDGRPPQQVQNYAVTRDTLYVLDGARRREIPIDQLDVPGTEKTNRDAGLDFSVPASAE